MSEGYECEKIAIEKIKHFVSKEAFNIDGFGKKIVENFWNLKLIRLPQDIFNLPFDVSASFAFDTGTYRPQNFGAFLSIKKTGSF